jgi:hypothetical protein
MEPADPHPVVAIRQVLDQAYCRSYSLSAGQPRGKGGLVSAVLRPGRGAGLYVCWHRNELDNRDHAVTDEEFARGRRNAQGRYTALCGHVMLPGSMLLPPGRPCPRCHASLVARPTPPAVGQRLGPPRHRKRKPPRWRWPFRSSQPSAMPEPRTRQPRPMLNRSGRTPTPPRAGSAPLAPVPAGRHALRGER